MNQSAVSYRSCASSEYSAQDDCSAVRFSTVYTASDVSYQIWELLGSVIPYGLQHDTSPLGYVIYSERLQYIYTALFTHQVTFYTTLFTLLQTYEPVT